MRITISNVSQTDMSTNLQVLLDHRPSGTLTEDCFRLVEGGVPALRAGEVLVRNRWLSIDPYMRMRVSATPSYTRHVSPGEVMVGGTVGEVLESRHAKFKPGEFVTGALGWQQFGAAEGGALRRVDPQLAPLSAYLGALGMPGVTAWVGLVDIGQAKAGDTVVVSAASGAVGSVVGQLAKNAGCRTVGIAGGRAKCDYVVGELGFDACIDYKAGNLAAELRAACRDGVDVYFDNVGGEILDTLLQVMNPFSRIPLCGTISQYEREAEPYGVKGVRSLLTNRIKLQGFIVSDRPELWKPALKELLALHAQGKLRYRESIAEGLPAAPRALLDVLAGRNFGKQLVRIEA